MARSRRQRSKQVSQSRSDNSASHSTQQIEKTSSTKTEQESNKYRSLVDSAIIIAVFSALVYIFTFAFESGFCSYFSISIELISLNYTNFIMVYLLSSLIFLVFCLIYINTKNINKKFKIILCVIFIVGSLLYSAYVFLYKTSIIPPNVFSILIFILISALIASLISISEFFKSIKDEFNVYIIIALLISTQLFLMAVYNELGKYLAEIRPLYYIIEQYKENKDYAVLRIYGDYLLASPLSNSPKLKKGFKNEVERRLFILKLSDMNNKPPLIYKDVGPLQAK